MKVYIVVGSEAYVEWNEAASLSRDKAQEIADRFNRMRPHSRYTVDEMELS